jgi:hypothetical protein
MRLFLYGTRTRRMDADIFNGLWVGNVGIWCFFLYFSENRLSTTF